MAEPKLRFKRDNGSDYPAWTCCQLQDIAERVTRKNKNNETDIPLTISSLDGLVDQRTYFGKTIASKDMSGYFLLQNGEFAYNKSYSVGFDYGSIKRLDRYDKGALSTLYICFALKDPKISDFMAHYFNSLVWNKEMPMICAEGARNHGLLNVAPADFFKITINIPSSVEERDKVISLLDAIDSVIASATDEVRLWEDKKKGVMQKIFSQEVRFKEENGEEYPEWEEVAIGELCDSITGYPFESKQFKSTGIKLVRGMNVKRGELDFSEDITVYWDSDAGLEGYRLKENDMIIQMDGALVGKSFGLIKNEELPALLVQRVTRLRANKDITQFIYQYFSTGIFNTKMMIDQTSSAVPHISLKDIRNFAISYPCAEERKKINDCLSSIDDVITIKKQKLETWKTIKKGLLQSMFV